ncbi:hypothetical protein RQN30_10685 [Arcanobacterium hippocoleae]
MPQTIKARPKYFTHRNKSRPTLGPIVAEIAKIIRGYELMPWQKYVINVAWELNPEHPGELWYTEGDISVPRQSGKSDLIEAAHLAGALMFSEWQSWMTAQTGKDAGKRWNNLVKHLKLYQGSRAHDWKIARSKGSEAAIYLPQLSSIAPFAPTNDALHGDRNNFITLDETWAFTLLEGTALETAAKPTFLTAKFTQLMRASTMGTANSEYLNRCIELGRAATKDPESHRFYFEWSANEKLAESDPYSDDTLSFHPAIGYTQSARRIRDLGRDMPIGDWRRSYLNLATQTAETIIDLARWDSLRWNYEPTEAERYRPARGEDIIICWDIAADGSSASIVASWLQDNEAGDPATALVASASGTSWLPEMLSNLSQQGYRRIVADDAGPNRTMLQELKARTIPTQAISYPDYATACQSLLDRIRTGALEHDGNKIFAEQICNAELKESGKVSILDPRKSSGAIDALRALAIAQDTAVRTLGAEIFQLY